MDDQAVEEALKEKVRGSLALLQDALWEYGDTTGKPPSFILDDHHPWELPQNSLRHCKVYNNRRKLLRQLPHPQIVAELGTLYGEFARFLLDAIAPKELHLFDLDLTVRVREDIRTAPTVTLHEGDSSDEPFIDAGSIL